MTKTVRHYMELLATSLTAAPGLAERHDIDRVNLAMQRALVPGFVLMVGGALPDADWLLSWVPSVQHPAAKAHVQLVAAAQATSLEQAQTIMAGVNAADVTAKPMFHLLTAALETDHWETWVEVVAAVRDASADIADELFPHV